MNTPCDLQWRMRQVFKYREKEAGLCVFEDFMKTDPQKELQFQILKEEGKLLENQEQKNKDIKMIVHSQCLQNKSIKDGVVYLWNLVEQVSQDPGSEKSRDFFNDLPNILYLILGAENKKGWLTQSFEDMTNPSRFSTQNPEDNLLQLVLLLSPPTISSDVTQIPQRENLYTLLFERELVEVHRFELSPSVLPDHIVDLRKNANLFEGDAAHITEQFIVLAPGDWFMFALVYNLKNFRSPKGMRACNTGNDNLMDPYASEFVQNPFLFLLRKYLEYFDFLSVSHLYLHKDKKHLFKKLCFILEEQLIIEQIYNINPQNIEVLLHYSILEGLNFSEFKHSVLRKKSSDPNAMMLGDSRLFSSSFEQQLNKPLLQKQSSQQSTSLGSSIASTIGLDTTIIDNVSGYSKANVTNNLMSIMNINEFSNKKGKESFLTNSSCLFQALLILLHFKRRHFKLLTIASLSSSSGYTRGSAISANTSNSNIYPRYSQQRPSSAIRNSYSSFQQGQQQNIIILQQEYQRYREQVEIYFDAENFPLEYFRDHGEDNMLSLFFKQISLFLCICLDNQQNNTATKYTSETLYDQGRLLVSLLGHFKYFEQHSCEENLFTFFDEEQSLQTQLPQQPPSSSSSTKIPTPPIRPLPWNFSLNDPEFDRLLPNLYIEQNIGQQQFERRSTLQLAHMSNYRQQIGFFTDELSQIRFKMLIAASTILMNKYIGAFSTLKEVQVSDMLILSLLMDVLYAERRSHPKRQGDENLISRVNCLDLVTIKHANEFFLLRESTDDAYRVFSSPDQLEPLRKVASLVSQFLKKRTTKGSKSEGNEQQVDHLTLLDPEEHDPMRISLCLKAKIELIFSRQFATSSIYPYKSQFKHVSRDEYDAKKDNSFQIENKRPSYDFQAWQAPLASFESSILFQIFLHLSFFIDFIKNSFQPTHPKQRYPKTNLRKYSNIYLTLSYLLLIIVLVFLFWLYVFSPSSSSSSSSHQQKIKPQQQKSKYEWNLID